MGQMLVPCEKRGMGWQDISATVTDTIKDKGEKARKVREVPETLVKITNAAFKTKAESDLLQAACAKKEACVLSKEYVYHDAGEIITTSEDVVPTMLVVPTPGAFVTMAGRVIIEGLMIEIHVQINSEHPVYEAVKFSQSERIERFQSRMNSITKHLPGHHAKKVSDVASKGKAALMKGASFAQATVSKAASNAKDKAGAAKDAAQAKWKQTMSKEDLAKLDKENEELASHNIGGCDEEEEIELLDEDKDAKNINFTMQVVLHINFMMHAPQETTNVIIEDIQLTHGNARSSKLAKWALGREDVKKRIVITASQKASFCAREAAEKKMRKAGMGCCM